LPYCWLGAACQERRLGPPARTTRFSLSSDVNVPWFDRERDSADEKVQLAAIIAQYRAELVRLYCVRGSINVYLRSIRRLFWLMEE
jgi:hypothetical protein